MAEGRFRSLLSASLGALKAEQPALHRALAARLEGLTVSLRVDGEALALGSAGGAISLSERGADGVDVCVETSRAAILDLLDGRQALREAILADRLWLQGPPLALADGFDALQLYLEGAVRAPSFPLLIDRYREG